MIGKISGHLDYVAEDHALIDCAGVGYLVFCAPPTLRELPEPGEPVALYTELVVREDLMQLFGFRTLAEREWHKLLVSVQGVGAKVSLAILGTLGIAGLTRALAAGDAAAVKATPGVGPKLATRIVTELKGKAPDMMAMGASKSRAAMPGSMPVPSPGTASQTPSAPTPDNDAMAASAAALSALVNLGYDRVEAAAAVADAAADGTDDEGNLIKAALQALGRNL